VGHSGVPWHARLRARYRLRRTLGLWYHRDYAPEALRSTRRLALPLDRVDRCVGLLAREGLLRRGDLRPAPPASFGELEAAHARAYLETVTEPETLGRIFGLEPSEVPVDALLSAQRRAVGGTLAAARAVARGERTLGFNLGGGFHHAEPEQGSGFCVFNDVTVAVAVLRREGFAGPVAVVDLDYHQGNGTAAAFSADPSVLTYSIQGSTWSRLEAPQNVEVSLPSGTGDPAYLEALHRTLPPVLERHRPRLVFYVAGNDVLAGDALGDFSLSLDGLFARDRMVVESVRRLGAAMVVVMGGGYGPDAWRGSARFLRWLLTGSRAPVPSEAPDVRASFEAVARLDDSVGLRLSEAEIMGQLTGYQVGGMLLLGFFSAHGVEYALERYGVMDALRRRGFHDLRVTLDASDPAHQVVRVYGRRVEEALLLELVVRRRRLPSVPGLPEGIEMLAVEWLLLQDPTASFTPSRPAMPGQKHPGLGLGATVIEMLVQACRRLDLGGLLATPARYANAVVGSRWFRFLDPRVEGRMVALQKVLADRSLEEAARLMEAGSVRTREGPLRWEPADQALPLHPGLVACFESGDYRRARDEEARRLLDAGLEVAEG
jgi:acetoin utilization deacetylase AcuC-like enzyme